MTAAEGEHYEWSEMYDDMACVAREEGFEQIARQMDQVAAIEKADETRYRKLWENIKTQQVFARDSEVTWICGSCGHEVKNRDTPNLSVCHHAQGIFGSRRRTIS